MTRTGRLAALGVVSSILLAINTIPDGPVSLVTITLTVTVALAWWLTSGFWKKVALGAVGGILAGLVILAPGWRVAMRVVAVMDPWTAPGFTIGGTIFILIVIGAVPGGVMGIVSNLLRHVTGIRSILISGIALGLLVTGSLLAHPDLRREVIDLGGGLWVNLSLFGTVSILYGIAAMRVTDFFASKTKQRSETSERDPTPDFAPSLLSRQSRRN